jgi:hypothetical protein
MFESYSQLPLSYTTFVDISGAHVTAHKVVSLQRMANGITATPDMQTVFIAESARGGFGIYTRTAKNKLDFKEFISINGLTDNLHFNDDGYIDKDNWGESSVIVGAHPNIVRLVKFAKGERNAPSWIVSVRPAKDGLKKDAEGLYRASNYKDDWHVKTELQDDGTWFGGVTGGMIDAAQGVMIGSGLYDENGAFICRKVYLSLLART